MASDVAGRGRLVRVLALLTLSLSLVLAASWCILVLGWALVFGSPIPTIISIPVESVVRLASWWLASATVIVPVVWGAAAARRRPPAVMTAGASSALLGSVLFMPGLFSLALALPSLAIGAATASLLVDHLLPRMTLPKIAAQPGVTSR